MEISNTGIVLFNDDEAFDLLFKGFLINEIGLEDSHFNKMADYFDKPDEKSIDISKYPTLEERAKQWLIDLPDIDVRLYLLQKCKTEEEFDRVNLEMDMFVERELLPILKLMIYLVDNFRKNNIVWGVGRGSSVSSFVLYLIGIHKIHSIRYGLDIKDFLK